MLAINGIALIACTTAIAKAALDSPSSTANSRSIGSFWLSTLVRRAALRSGVEILIAARGCRA